MIWSPCLIIWSGTLCTCNETRCNSPTKGENFTKEAETAAAVSFNTTKTNISKWWKEYKNSKQMSSSAHKSSIICGQSDHLKSQAQDVYCSGGRDRRVMSCLCRRWGELKKLHISKEDWTKKKPNLFQQKNLNLYISIFSKLTHLFPGGMHKRRWWGFFCRLWRRHPHLPYCAHKYVK